MTFKTPIAVLCLVAGHTAFAQSAASGDARPLTRAEVIADLNLWKQAGLHRADGDADLPPAALAAAQARYERLRAGQAFDEEVRRVAARRGGTQARTESRHGPVPAGSERGFS